MCWNRITTRVRLWATASMEAEDPLRGTFFGDCGDGAVLAFLAVELGGSADDSRHRGIQYFVVLFDGNFHQCDVFGRDGGFGGSDYR